MFSLEYLYDACKDVFQKSAEIVSRTPHMNWNTIVRLDDVHRYPQEGVQKQICTEIELKFRTWKENKWITRVDPHVYDNVIRQLLEEKLVFETSHLLDLSFDSLPNKIDLLQNDYIPESVSHRQDSKWPLPPTCRVTFDFSTYLLCVKQPMISHMDPPTSNRRTPKQNEIDWRISAQFETTYYNWTPFKKHWLGYAESQREKWRTSFFLPFISRNFSKREHGEFICDCTKVICSDAMTKTLDTSPEPTYEIEIEWKPPFKNDSSDISSSVYCDSNCWLDTVARELFEQANFISNQFETFSYAPIF